MKCSKFSLFSGTLLLTVAYFHLAEAIAGASPQPHSSDGSFAVLSQYYGEITANSGDPLRNQLQARIATGHIVQSYDNVTLAIRQIDRDPDNPNNVLLIYSGISVDAFSNWTEWNRDHIWPRSSGVGQSGPGFSDFHHLYPCNPGVNTSRSNHSFDWLPQGNPVNNAPGSKRATNWFEPLDYDKGRVARAMLYMDLRYDGSDAGTPNLQLQEFHDPSENIMGKRSTLLEWNRMFPPDQRERLRNDIIYSGFQSGQQFIFQGNRNPFIDYPDLADAIHFDDPNVSWGAWRVYHFSINGLSDSQSDLLGDPDGDSIPNLLEYFQGTDPNVPSSLLVSVARDSDTPYSTIS